MVLFGTVTFDLRATSIGLGWHDKPYEFTANIRENRIILVYAR